MARVVATQTILRFLRKLLKQLQNIHFNLEEDIERIKDMILLTCKTNITMVLVLCSLAVS